MLLRSLGAKQVPDTTQSNKQLENKHVVQNIIPLKSLTRARPVNLKPETSFRRVSSTKAFKGSFHVGEWMILRVRCGLGFRILLVVGLMSRLN